MIEERRKYDFDRVVRILFATACVVAVVYLINYLSGVLLPFFVACLLAYIIHPLVRFNKRWMHCKGNVLPVVVTLLMVVAVISAALYVLLPYIYDETSRMVAMLGEYTSKRLDVKYLPPEVVEFLRQHVDVNEIVNLLSKEQWMKLVGDVFKETWLFVGATANVIMNILSWFIAVIYLIFILIDYEKVSKGFSRAIPHRYRSGVLDVVNDVKRAMNMYFRGQALIALIVGILFAIGFSIVGFPMAVALGLFIGLLNLVPYLQLISIPIAFFLCLVDAVATGSNFWVLCGWTSVVYCVVQAFQDIYLTPRIMGKYMAINPVLILLSLSVWGALLGFVGLIIALPLTALLLSYYKQYVLTLEGETEALAKRKVTPNQPASTDSEGRCD